jgi:hypothetical protein
VNKKAANFKAAVYSPTPSDSKDDFGKTDENNQSSDPPASSQPDNCDTEGFKWSLSAFQKWLSLREGEQRTEETFKRIHDLCVKTMIAAESEITPNVQRSVAYRTNCFELFGLDIILDANLNPHLLEVNVSPSLMGSSPLDRRIKGMLLADIFHTVGTYPYDPHLLRKYSNSESLLEELGNTSSKSNTPCGSPRTSEANSNKFKNISSFNPFGFINLSKLLANQGKF